MSDNISFDQFFSWLQTVDPGSFQNEAEVESKFVVPLFQYLEYPEACRRPQFSLKMYEPRKRGGRGQAIDQIYFSTEKQQEQTGDTSLIIVEAKEPGETHFDEALEQARSYGYRLTPLFLVVTNAHRLLVVKQHRYRGEEQLFDVTLGQLQEQETAHQLYRQLRFDVVKHLKEQLTDDLTHKLYVDLMHALNSHPDLRDQLDRGDFVQSRTQEGRRLTVTMPKVLVTSDLPLAYGDGACRIEFSNLLLRGLTCHLTHRQILESLMTGLDSPPHWGTRRFLRMTEDRNFEAQLGQTTVILSEQEANELCACIDDVCHAYKTIIVDAEDTLQTWDYPSVTLPEYHMHGFNILTVEPWLWKLMLQFTHTFDIFAGTSPWHIFDEGNDYIRVLHNHDVEQALIYPSYGPWHHPTRTVDLLYCVEKDRYFAAEEQLSELSWKQAIGPTGRWTAQYTESWLINTFIPRVLEQYPDQRPKRAQLPYLTAHDSSEEHVPLDLVYLPQHLAPYIHQIQRTFHHYGDCHIASSLLRPYYTALTELVQHIDPSTLALRNANYIYSRVHGAMRRANYEQFSIFEKEKASSKEQLAEPLNQDAVESSSMQEVNQIMDGLKEHVRRIYQVEHESPRVADYLSSAFIALLEHGTIRCEQEHLNAVKEAIYTLLDLSRFEERYVSRLPWE